MYLAFRILRGRPIEEEVPELYEASPHSLTIPQPQVYSRQDLLPG